MWHEYANTQTFSVYKTAGRVCASVCRGTRMVAIDRGKVTVFPIFSRGRGRRAYDSRNTEVRSRARHVNPYSSSSCDTSRITPISLLQRLRESLPILQQNLDYSEDLPLTPTRAAPAQLRCERRRRR